MVDVRGTVLGTKGPRRVLKDIVVDKVGRLITRSILQGLNRFGKLIPIRVSDDGTLLTGPEVWTQKDSQQVTVSTTRLPIASLYTDDLTDDIQRIDFQLVSGGPIHISSAAGRDVTAGGSEGSRVINAGDEWSVTGLDDIAKHQAIRASGGSDGTVTVWPYKRVRA